ncbi:MAG: hypothetical protein WB760_00365 [Xanthobacteraceae bacterium]
MAAAPAFAQTAQTIALPAPVMTGGKSLMQALKDRQSIREYADRPLSNQDLSNLLWAAWVSIGPLATVARRRAGATPISWTFISPGPMGFGILILKATGCCST